MTRDVFPLLNHLWQSTLVAAIAWLGCATLLRANGARVRHAVWLAVSLKFLVPFAAIVEAGQLIAPRPFVSPSQSQHIFDIVSGGSGVLAIAPFHTALPPQAAPREYAVVSALLFAVWGLGAALVLSRWPLHWWTIRRVANDAQPAGSFRGVPVRRSARMHDRRLEPGIFGLWRPIILLPHGIHERLSKTQLRAILEHEWHHARRRDNLTAFVHVLTQALFWFHPVVWVVGRKLVHERERACDQAVLESAEPDDYAEGILRVCRFYCAPAHGPAAGITGANLKARVESILNNERPRELGPARRWALALTACLAVAGPVGVGLLTQQAVSAQQGNSFVGLATSADKKFEIASIKSNASGDPEWRLGPPRNGGISIVNLPLFRIIAQSFRTNVSMLAGGPDWIRSTNYDIVGKGPDPSMTNPEVWEMMRSLLIDRFHLKYHIEERDMPAFALTIAPRGHKLTLGENGQCAEEIKAGKNCGDILIPPFGAAMYNMPIGALITGIGQRAGRPIVDRTGLTGRFDVNITWLPPGAKLEELNLEDVPQEYRPQDMSLFEALEKQAGLKLEPQRAPMPMVVIDSISRPDPD